jgi:hypothetical protein
MSNVGIYGDSWGDPRVRRSDITFDNIIWSDIIKDKHDVTNYCRGGTSIHYSFKKFIDTYDKHDKIIFIVTDHMRWHTLIETTRSSPWGDFNHAIAGPGMIDVWYKDPGLSPYITPELSDTLDALRKYFLHLNSEDFNTSVCRLMLEEIQRKRPDTIFIQGGLFLPFSDLTNMDTAIANFALRWIKNWPEFENIVKDGYGFFPWREEKTIGHFSKEVNQVISVQIIDALNKGKWEPVIPDFIPAEHGDFGYYYNHKNRIW